MKLSIALVATAIAVGSVAATTKDCNTGACCFQLPDELEIKGGNATNKGGYYQLDDGKCTLHTKKGGHKVVTYKTSNGKCKSVSHQHGLRVTSSGHHKQEGKTCTGKGQFSIENWDSWFKNSAFNSQSFSYSTDVNSKGEQFSGGSYYNGNGNGYSAGQTQSYEKNKGNRHVSATSSSSSYSNSEGDNHKWATPGGGAGTGGYFNNQQGSKSSFNKDVDVSHSYGSGSKSGQAWAGNDGYGNGGAAYRYGQNQQGGSDYYKHHTDGYTQQDSKNSGQGGIEVGPGGLYAGGKLQGDRSSKTHYRDSESDGQHSSKSWNNGQGVAVYNDQGQVIGYQQSDKGSADHSKHHSESTAYDAKSHDSSYIGGEASPDGIHGSAGKHHSDSQYYAKNTHDDQSDNYKDQQQYKTPNGSGYRWKEGHSSSWKDSHVEQWQSNSQDQKAKIDAGN
ncbi:uncharacterized protein PFL1_05474 [Pseudozyma flocculosa PF-1]|uniref:Uncharacterized protein n=2 Tax=Pseudozyma flocculosa TaxID=84751 RepID=A0A5C3FF43_9BASI|nr:uncharacterized protein PFL1_05474 [Pseudozyma flocculosa PF-1]EPQ26839.1 hypothetical protein PFL1_05474 [Pseudozyma flocculosa PF-1]SPO42091.1 uncharacterized protein PSFLO_07574 [Pseudozyma flocculosa]